MVPPRKLRFAPGDRYGRLTVIAEDRLPNTPGRARHGFKTGQLGARCRCDCGNELLVAANRLTSGNTRSCGCLRIEVASERLPELSEANKTHGLAGKGPKKHPLYRTWSGMMQRCYSEQHMYFHRYGLRGIEVCERWQDPAAFITDIETALGPRPAGMTLDRIDPDGDYKPGNVRWATALQQRHNRSLE